MTLSNDRWRLVKHIFQRALELPRDEWPAFLDRTCLGDEELLSEVESLLAEHDVEDDSLLSAAGAE
jgi:hypothetical protein